jgi:hypothetical protein
MTSEEKRAYWKSHIAGWQQSNTSQRIYCEQHDLKPSAFAYWRSRLARSRGSSKLIPVSVSTHQVVTLTLAGALQLDVPVVMLEQVLPTVLRIMQEAR